MIGVCKNMPKIGKVVRDPNFPLAFVRGNVAIGMNPRTKRQKRLQVIQPIIRKSPNSIVFIKKNGDVEERPRAKTGSRKRSKKATKRKTSKRKTTKKKTTKRKKRKKR